MADNRVFLVHKPTMIGISLGKRYGSGWYCTNDDLSGEINRFYDYIANNYSPVDDDFVLFFENDMSWSYTSERNAEGFRVFAMANEDDE